MDSNAYTRGEITVSYDKRENENTSVVEMPHEVCMTCGFKTYEPSNYFMVQGGRTYRATKITHRCPNTEYEWEEIPATVGN